MSDLPSPERIEELRRLLKSEDFRWLIKRTQRGLIDEWVGSNPEQAGNREHLWRMHQSLDRLESCMTSTLYDLKKQTPQ